MELETQFALCIKCHVIRLTASEFDTSIDVNSGDNAKTKDILEGN